MGGGDFCGNNCGKYLGKMGRFPKFSWLGRDIIMVEDCLEWIIF